MIKSMTGFGKAICEFENKKIVAEIRSLNSRQIDISTRISGFYREKDIEIRNIISQHLGRGKIDFSLYIDNSQKDTAISINKQIISSYHQQIQEIANDLNVNTPEDWFSIMLRMPDVMMKSEEQELSKEEWEAILNSIHQAISLLNKYREEEGKALEKALKENIKNIQTLSKKIEKYEKERIQKVRERLDENLKNISENIQIDNNRLEQELIYYIEKLDINEEKVRLQQHLEYFLETMKEEASGKKLGFITQEIGREINTMGSKSNQADMQKIVVLMKDELEQIKEQILNIL